MPFTHAFNLLALVGTFFPATTVCVIGALAARSEQLRPAGSIPPWGILGVAITTAIVIVGLGTKFLFPFANQMYVRLFLRTPITFSEAVQISPLFYVNRTGTWFSMKEVRNLPVAERLARMQLFLKQCREEGIIKA